MKAYLERNEVDTMERQAACLRDRLLVRVLFRTGCRVSEALGLEAKDIDLDQGSLTIERLKARVRLLCPECGSRLSKTSVFCPRCGSRVEKTVSETAGQRRMRTLPLDGDTLDLLRDYIDRGGPVSVNGRRLIFGINRHRAWQIIRELAQKAGLEGLLNPETGRLHNVSPHKLRDAFAVMAVQKDDSTDAVRMLQEQLGHASISTTMRYRKVAGGELKEWYERLWEEA
jgi:integrase/recombinase XerD